MKKKHKGIRICLDNITIGTQYEEENFYPLNDNSLLQVSILEGIVFAFIQCILSFKKIVLLIVKTFKIFL